MGATTACACPEYLLSLSGLLMHNVYTKLGQSQPPGACRKMQSHTAISLDRSLPTSRPAAPLTKVEQPMMLINTSETETKDEQNINLEPNGITYNIITGRHTQRHRQAWCNHDHHRM